MSFPKPEPYRKVKARQKRNEDKIKRMARLDVVRRDGSCRLLRSGLGQCSGPSEWNHWPKRSLTRGRPASERHSTKASMMLCRHHHQLVDDHFIRLIAQSAELGADGLLLAVHRDGRAWVELAVGDYRAVRV